MPDPDGVQARSSSEGGTVYIGGHTYSGADIKLVVHMPMVAGDPRDEALVELEAERDRLTELLQEAQGEAEFDQAVNSIRSLRDQRDVLYTELALTEGDEAQAAIESQISDLNDQITALEPLASAREEHGSRGDIRSQLETTTRSIESMRQGRDIPSNVTKVLAEVQTLSVSTHREKGQVRTLGSVYPRGIVRGPRTISGSMVFTVFHKHIFHDLFQTAGVRSTGVGDWDAYRWTTFMTDQLPPLDVSIVFANEYGNISWMGILGVDFVNEGMTMSIEDLFVEGTAQYIARDLDHIRNVANRPMTREHGVGESLTGSSILMEDLITRSRGRRDPFI